ncbi:MAG: lipoyl(octanoyl) transferase LipB [Opitutaceae bacterium]|nr:lipoyl(octanoyl) transferase LipB [Opitutaceae bacterium]
MTPPSHPPGVTIDWGRTRYREAWQRQDLLLAARLAGTAPDTLVFTEHEPVYTLGVRRGAEQNLVWTPPQLAAQGIEVVPTNRGGDITYHGPGQVVGYPIVSLDSRRDLHAYLRFLEQVLIDTVARHGLCAARREGKTGIWLGPRKIAAIGVAVKRWVAHHGFALNVTTNLTHFAGIVPCGITDGTVTSLAAELGPRCPTLDEVRAQLSEEFWARWPRFCAGTD